MIDISHYGCNSELRVVVAFLTWQNSDIIKTDWMDDHLILKETDGRPSIRIAIGDKVVYSYRQLINYWEENGLWRS